MTDKLKCCFCGAELQEFGGGDFLLLHYCDNINCNLYHIMGQYTLWQELIRTRKALDVAKESLKYARQRGLDNTATLFAVGSKADKALEQITALEQKDEE